MHLEGFINSVVKLHVAHRKYILFNFFDIVGWPTLILIKITGRVKEIDQYRLFDLYVSNMPHYPFMSHLSTSNVLNPLNHF